MCKEMGYLESGIPGNMEKSVYYSCESWIVAACHLPGRNTLGHLSLNYDNSFGPLFQFPERNMLLATSYREVITQSSFTKLGCWQQVWQSTLPEHSLLNSLLMKWCSLSLSSLTQLSNDRDICLCSHGVWSLMAEVALLSLQGGCSLKPEGNTHGFICLFLTKATWLKCLRFLKTQALAY